jgi:hypothetical protein
LTCFGAGGRIQRTSLIDVVAGTNPQPANCIRNGGTFLFNPSGWLNSGLTWQQLGGSAQYPPVNVSPRVPLDQKQFISMPFVARQVENMNYFVAPDGALGTGYEGFYLTISECSGDFRSPSSNANVLADEPTLDASCRMFFSGKIEKRIFTTDAVAGQCRVIPGRSYFLNIIQAGGPDSILQGQSLCPSARCSFLSNFRG